MNVLLLSRYGRLGASTRLRHLQFLPALQAAGIAVDVCPLLEDEYLQALYAGAPRPLGRIAAAYWRRVIKLIWAGRYDGVWLQREALPWLPAGIEYAAGLRRVPYIVDYDDAWFHRYDRHHAAVVRGLLGGKIDRLMSRSAMVTVCNEYLAQRARSAGAPRVERLPTVVDLERYQVAPGGAPRPFTIGWIGSPTTARFLTDVAAPLRELAGRFALRMVTIGSGPITLEGIDHQVVPWAEASEVAGLNAIDVGIMPLTDDDWNRGKCAYKLIQYMACAKPVVGSAVGMNTEIIRAGHNGYLARGPRDWVDALARLHDDPAHAAALGQAGRATVAAEYSLSVIAPRLARLMEQVFRPGNWPGSRRRT